jgi:hypothetical protein
MTPDGEEAREVGIDEAPVCGKSLVRVSELSNARHVIASRALRF